MASPPRTPTATRHSGTHPRARRGMLRRRRRAVVLLLLAVAATLVTVQVVRRSAGDHRASDPPPTASGAGSPSAGPSPTASASPSPSPSRSPVPTGTPVLSYPHSGPGTFAFAGTDGPVLGSAGQVITFRVGVENGTGQSPTVFAGAVDRILGDARSWIASGQLRLRRVAQGPADFTIYLATEGTSERMCLEDGLHTDGYTSCRLASGKVVINLARWLTAVPHYGAPLAVYQAYAITHEVGHQLGHGHERCPAPGALAPVMEQQTLGLYGCRANSWPYVDGRRYAGPPGSYTPGN